MLASIRPNQGKRGRRGIVLVLVLGMLALMALIGITFATFSGQSRISARNFFQSMNQPQRDELMDYALSQLISDTPDIRSRDSRPQLGPRHVRQRRGESTATSLPARTERAHAAPYNDSQFYIQQIQQVGTRTLYDLRRTSRWATRRFYGYYNFTRWTCGWGTWARCPPDSRQPGCQPDARHPRRRPHNSILGTQRQHGPTETRQRPLHLDAGQWPNLPE